MSKEISIESLYANGMGIELPISNNDNKQTQESYDCSNIIDLQSIENDLSYLNVFNTLDNTHTNDMIKLHNKLNKEYGKHNKSLESYLDTRIHSLEEEKKGNKFIEMVKTVLGKIAEFFKKIGSFILTVFKRLIITLTGQYKDLKNLYNEGKNKTIVPSFSYKDFIPRKSSLTFSESKKIVTVLEKYNKQYSINKNNVGKIINELSAAEMTLISGLFPQLKSIKNKDEFFKTLKGLMSKNNNSVATILFNVKPIDSEKEKITISELFKNDVHFIEVYNNFKEESVHCVPVGNQLIRCSSDIEKMIKNISNFDDGNEEDGKELNHLIVMHTSITSLMSKIYSVSKIMFSDMSRILNVLKGISEKPKSNNIDEDDGPDILGEQRSKIASNMSKRHKEAGDTMKSMLNNIDKNLDNSSNDSKINTMNNDIDQLFKDLED